MTVGKKEPRPPSECPVCGADVPPKSRACPECGADERTGWNEEKTAADGLDLPDESFDYEEALKDVGLKRRMKPKSLAAFWWIIGVMLAAVLILRAVGFGF